MKPLIVLNDRREQRNLPRWLFMPVDLLLKRVWARITG